MLNRFNISFCAIDCTFCQLEFTFYRNNYSGILSRSPGGRAAVFPYSNHSTAALSPLPSSTYSIMSPG